MWDKKRTEISPEGRTIDLRDLVGSPGVLPTDEGAGRVLIVDDDVALRMLMLRILRRSGYTSLTATSTGEARELMKSERFGVLVTDLRMFAEDGIELVRHAKDNYPDVFSIVVTGFADDEMEDRVQRAGAYALLRKPFEAPELAALVERAFEQRTEAVALSRHRSM